MLNDNADFDSLVGIEIIDDGISQVIISDESPSIHDAVVSSSKSRNASRIQNNIPISANSNCTPPQQRKQNHTSGLSWRSDPKASFSDWTIEVTTVEDDQITWYNCHSNVLVWGPRRCNGFVKLFNDRIKQMPHSTITQIELSPSEAEAFPSLLDFMYCEATLSLSANRVCSIYALAERFENEMLMTAIQTFVETYLDFDQSIEFLSYTRRQQNREKFDKLVLLTNSKICGYLAKYPKEASKVPPEMLAHILHRRAQVMKVLKGEDPRKFSGDWEIKRSRVLSTVVSECCFHAIISTRTKHPLTRQTFERLTNPKHLPALDSHAAFKMMQVDSFLSSKECDDASKANDKRSLSSFESRCIHALVSEWRNIVAENSESLFKEVLPNMRSPVLAEILLQVSKQYERKLGADDTPRHHDILGNLELNVFTNRTSLEANNNWSVQSPHESAVEHRKAPSSIREGRLGVRNISNENFGEGGFNEEEVISPVNRYSVAQNRH